MSDSSEATSATSSESALEGRSSFLPRSMTTVGQLALDRIYSFRITYIAVAIFILLYVFSVQGVERLLQQYFSRVVAEAVQITNLSVPVVLQIQSKIDRYVMKSRCVRIAGVEVSVLVLGRDGLTWIYVDGRAVPPPTTLDPAKLLREAERLLPASEEAIVAVPHNALLANAILVLYATALLQTLFIYNRAVARRENRHLAEALSTRDAAAQRTQTIERELEAVRQRLLAVEPTEREQTQEIRDLQLERESLQQKLQTLANREEELRTQAAQAVDLDQERRALEELLDEASVDLSTKDEEIRALEKSLKRATRDAPTSTGRTREVDLVGRRMHTLYKTLEIDDRAIGDMVALRDETMKLKAEEAMKRLADESDNVSVRRKVGGLPPHLSIFELGFAGKGRIYYTKGQQRRFRVLTIGAKNTQKTNLDYLRRLNP